MERTRWIFLDQLGPHFDDGGPMLLVESKSSWRGRTLHRAKLQLLLSAIRHRARDLGDRVDFRQVEHYSEVVDGRDDLQVIDPTSYRARRLVRRVGAEILPSRGFVTSESDFAAWADSRAGKRLLMEDFYRVVRQRTGVLMEGRSPPAVAGTTTTTTARSPEGRRLARPARTSLARGGRHRRGGAARHRPLGARRVVTLVGDAGPRRFAATAVEAEAALADFVEVRLPDFGPFEDATLSGDWTMAHSLISAPMNLGLLDPREVIDTVAAAYAAGDAPIRSVEGFVRQVMGWRDYMWHLYWRLGEDYATSNNKLAAHEPLPQVFATLGRDLGVRMAARASRPTPRARRSSRRTAWPRRSTGCTGTGGVTTSSA